MKIIQQRQIIEEWRSIGRPGFYELLVEMSPDEVPDVGEAIEIDGVGGANIEDVIIARAEAPGLVRARLDVWLAGD